MADGPAGAATKPQFRFYRPAGGIAGLLLFFLVTQVVAIALIAWRLWHTARELAAVWSIGDYVPLYRPLLVFEAGGRMLLLAAMSLGVALILRKHPRTPGYYQAMLLSSAGFAALLLVGSTIVTSQIAELAQANGGSSAAVEQAGQETWATNLRAIGSSLLWLWYWRTSTRVAATFEPVDAFVSGPLVRNHAHIRDS